MNLSAVNFLLQIPSATSSKSCNNKINFTAKPDTFEKTTTMSPEEMKQTLQKAKKEAEQVRKRAKKLRGFAIKEAKNEKWTRKDDYSVETREFTRNYDGKILTIKVSRTDRVDKHSPKGFHYAIPEGKLSVWIREEDPAKVQINRYDKINKNGACLYTERSLKDPNCMPRTILFWGDGSLNSLDRNIYNDGINPTTIQETIYPGSAEIKKNITCVSGKYQYHIGEMHKLTREGKIESKYDVYE